MKRLALLFLAPALLGADAELNRHQWEDRVSIRTKHFLVESNTSREIALSLATRLEASYPLFENRFGPLRAGKSAPMRLLLYRTRDEYMQLGDHLALELAGPPTRVAEEETHVVGRRVRNGLQYRERSGEA